MDARWKVTFAFIGVFVAGSVFGGFFAARIGQQVANRERPRSFVARPQQPQFGAPQPVQAAQFMRRFAERLDLTDAQREKIRPITARAEEKIGRIRQMTLEQTDAALRQAQHDFRAELNDDQRRKLDRMQQAQGDAVRRERMRRQQQKLNGPGPQGGQVGPNQRPNQPVPDQQRRPFQNRRPQNPRPPGGDAPPGAEADDAPPAARAAP